MPTQISVRVSLTVSNGDLVCLLGSFTTPNYRNVATVWLLGPFVGILLCYAKDLLRISEPAVNSFSLPPTI
jgi:hypothetical protein